MVEMSLEAVAFAEPRVTWRFRTSALTERARRLELVPQSGTQRADFRARLPRWLLRKSRFIPLDAMCELTAARTTVDHSDTELIRCR
jgi:hypothetical protein